MSSEIMKPKVVILAGGMGMRLREETEYKPKPMAPWPFSSKSSYYPSVPSFPLLVSTLRIIYLLNSVIANRKIVVHQGNIKP